jgi:CheY-like chemotaxis protein
MRLDDVLHLLGNHRDYLILALAVLVLVEGGIIVLWARRAVLLRRELQQAVSAAEGARVAAERAAAVATEKSTYKPPAAPAAPARREREVYSVAARADAEGAPLSPARPAAAVPAPAPLAPPAPAWTPPAPATASAPATPPAAPSLPPVAPVAPEPVAAAEPPAEYVSPVVEQAAAWVLPEVEASQPAGPAPEPPATTPSNGNGHGNGWFPAAAAPTTPTTMGWSNRAVPVEPAADFAVLSERDVTAPEPAPAANGNGNGNGNPSLTVLEGTRTWSFPAATPPAPAPAAVPTHFDPAMFDTNDDGLVDDLPISGDILLVEDDPTIAKLYRVLLESRGYTVRHAVDGLDGLDRANEKRPDLVLLDIMMPRMNGIAFLQALRSGPMRTVPVVVLSNFMEKQLVDDAMSLGALEYMVKAQTRPEALVGALPHWLRGERAFTY